MGIIVLSIQGLPPKGGKFDGVAMYSNGKPIVAIASSKKGPAWLAFYLAHELGHISLEHVKPDGGMCVDADLANAGVDEDTEEQEANGFALELLTGEATGITFESSSLKAPEVGKAALKFASKADPKIDPGVVVLSYCKSTGYWGVAKKALEIVGQSEGGHEKVRQVLLQHLDSKRISESEARFLAATCHLPL
ncbi:ImmA/IrrE family metallo-endopeptidase [Limnoglobus roseus]|uniref:Uncharacterized protein n=1 Tax=Limnoglobus roseus TaxID=2598579 RepID=A0A5C1AAX4_9BACT|nr:ImmA/IrrE family metallo-endopeptidase [Limnoglobus roseus]QEL14274.1 hypothetical protein PX52LOC_01145 [Limnoglobus roseus]